MMEHAIIGNPFIGYIMYIYDGHKITLDEFFQIESNAFLRNKDKSIFQVYETSLDKFFIGLN
jgi:hypothetical protein